MKRYILFGVTLLTMLFMAGCSGEQKTEDGDNSDSTDIKYADMIPDLETIFKDGTITVTDPDGGKAYMLEVTGYGDGEYESYIADCKDSGFTDISYETSHDRGKDFGAYTSDKEYWVQVNLDGENNVIYIICQQSKNSEESEE